MMSMGTPLQVMTFSMPWLSPYIFILNKQLFYHESMEFTIKVLRRAGMITLTLNCRFDINLKKNEVVERK